MSNLRDVERALENMIDTLKGKMNPPWRDGLVKVLLWYTPEAGIKALEELTLSEEWIPRPAKLNETCKKHQPKKEKKCREEFPAQTEQDVDYTQCLIYLKPIFGEERANYIAHTLLPLEPLDPRWCEHAEYFADRKLLTASEESEGYKALEYMLKERDTRRKVDNMATIQVQGRLTRDPESMATTTGTTFVRFSVADNSRGKDKVDFFYCKCYGKTSEFIGKFFRKGDWISVSGVLETWKDKENITRHTINVDRGSFVGNKAANTEPQPKQQPQPQQSYYPSDSNGYGVGDEDVPF